MTAIRGVILCGGRSSRMGTDKGMIKSMNNTWAKIAVQKISSLHLDTCLSVNQHQLNEYSGAFHELPLIEDDDTLQVKGPMTGILSVHLRYPHDDLLVLACDMPLMETVVLNQLLSVYQEDKSAQAFVFTNDAEPEPLCAVYTARGLAVILGLVHEKKITRFSIKFMLQHLTTVSIVLDDKQKKYFLNFNTQEELNRLQV
ncbi:MAG: molybdenum cofactor guanylyltransferase [Ferruginibacter sp.]